MTTNQLLSAASLILLTWFLFVFMHQHKEVEFWTDPGTACEYLISPNGTLVPRIDSAYMHGGCDPQEDY